MPQPSKKYTFKDVKGFYALRSNKGHRDSYRLTNKYRRYNYDIYNSNKEPVGTFNHYYDNDNNGTLTILPHYKNGFNAITDEGYKIEDAMTYSVSSLHNAIRLTFLRLQEPTAY